MEDEDAQAWGVDIPSHYQDYSKRHFEVMCCHLRKYRKPAFFASIGLTNPDDSELRELVVGV